MSLFNSLTSGGSQYAPKPFKRPSMGSSAPYMPTVVDQPRQGQSQIAFENEKRKLNHQRQMNNIFGYGHDGSHMQGSNQHMIGMGGRSKPVIGQPLRNTGGGGLPNLRETSAYKQGLTRNIDQNMGGYVNPSLFSDPNLGQPRPSGGIPPVTGGGFEIGGQPNPYQTNVDFMNQMAQQNAQVGSDGQSVSPSFSYDQATGQYSETLQHLV